MGGFLATRDEELARQEQDLLILTEGFPTYGGLAGRDLEALAVGMQEAVDEDYLHYRTASTRHVGERLREAGVPLLWPPGGHAIYLDARRFADHLEPTRFPGVAVSIALYLLGGVRACEIGSLMFGRRDPETGEEMAGPRELVRLAIPRRVYAQSHMDYVVEVVEAAFRDRASLPGYRIVEQAPFLRHFSARLEPDA
jgi:tryptophanase